MIATPGKIIPSVVLQKKTDSSAFLKKLLWLYFWLLIIEGALRKWFLPQLSAPLLIVRDPVVILIYFVALKDNLFPRNGFLTAFWFLAVLSFFLLLVQLISLELPFNVLLFGLRTNYLHLPLIFLLPKIFKPGDLYVLGKWILWISLPMSLLMAYQFRAAPGDWINRGAGVGGLQLESALGKIRPPGTFSFITGAVAFFALVAAYLGFAITSGRKLYPRWLIICTALSLGLAMVVSGSRSMILSVSLVAAGWLLGITAARQLAAGVWRIFLLLFGAAFLAVQIGQVEIFKEGSEVLSTRFESASGAEKAKGGITGRFLDTILTPLRSIDTVPFIGFGLGLGTNVGAALVQKGKVGFLLSEGEWGRVILEMGPILGLLFIIFRLALMVSLGKASLRCAQAGNLLPLLIWSACATNIFNGQLAQPTNLGFTVFMGGLCLSATQIVPPPKEKPIVKKPKIRTGW